ncbi:hypothetical protein [Haliangium sp.]|uniref:hypothetical protein n=1 Tax=Haliangium sp. TaxID=2663208 RepID=UPI003D0BCA17
MSTRARRVTERGVRAGLVVVGVVVGVVMAAPAAAQSQRPEMVAAIKGWQPHAGGMRVTVDGRALEALLAQQAPSLAQQAPKWVLRGFVWGRYQYSDLTPVIDDLRILPSSTPDEAGVVVRGGIMAKRSRGQWRWRGIRSGLEWTPAGRARVADMTIYGRIVMRPEGGRRLHVTARVDVLEGRFRMRPLDAVKFTAGLGGRPVHTQAIDLPDLGPIGLAVEGVRVAEVVGDDVVLDVAIGRVQASADE